METYTPDVMNQQGSSVSNIWGWVLLRGIVAILLGILLFKNTAATLMVIVMFLGAYWFIDGIFILVASIQGCKHYKRWGWGIFVGILSILAGLAIFFNPMISTIITTTFLVYFIGIIILISGFSSIITGFRLRKTSGEWVMILGGVLAVLLSLLLLFNPVISALMLVYMLGIFSIVSGIVLVILSFRIKKLGKIAA